MVLTFGAASRNKAPILNCLRPYLGSSSSFTMLELASGCGQHALHLVGNLSNLVLQPSEIEQDLIENIEARRQENVELASRLLKPIFFDLLKSDFSYLAKRFDGVYVSNLCHISPWATTKALFELAASDVLVDNGYLFIYGPFAEDGLLEPQSNRSFDQSLRSRNESWGIRDIRDLRVLAGNGDLKLENVHAMPANNRILVFKKGQQKGREESKKE